jgi:hypothetical protein
MFFWKLSGSRHQWSFCSSLKKVVGEIAVNCTVCCFSSLVSSTSFGEKVNLSAIWFRQKLAEINLYYASRFTVSFRRNFVSAKYFVPGEALTFPNDFFSNNRYIWITLNNIKQIIGTKEAALSESLQSKVFDGHFLNIISTAIVLFVANSEVGIRANTVY